MIECGFVYFPRDRVIFWWFHVNLLRFRVILCDFVGFYVSTYDFVWFVGMFWGFVKI